jgi:hypothetical protein
MKANKEDEMSGEENYDSFQRLKCVIPLADNVKKQLHTYKRV